MNARRLSKRVRTERVTVGVTEQVALSRSAAKTLAGALISKGIPFHCEPDGECFRFRVEQENEQRGLAARYE